MSHTLLDARVRLPGDPARWWARAVTASIVLHVVALAGLVVVESRWIAARFPARPAVPVALVPPAPEPEPARVATVPAPVPAPPVPQADPEPASRPFPAPLPPRDAGHEPDPVAPGRPANVSPWWSGRLSTVALVDDWRAGRVAPDTTWLPAVPQALAARDSAFLRMNRDFLDRIPEITYEAWAERQRRNFPLMR